MKQEPQQEQQEEQEQQQSIEEDFYKYENIDKINDTVIQQKFSNNYQFIEDVVQTEQQVYFFDIPKFGSQLNVKVIIEFYERDKIFDEYIGVYREYLEKVQEQKQLREKNQLEFEEKLAELEEKEEEKEKLTEEYNKIEYEDIIVQQPKNEKLVYLLSFDNLGQDYGITIQQKNDILKLCYYLQEKWNYTNKQNFIQVVEQHIKFQQQYNQQYFLEQEEEILQKISDFTSSIQNEGEKQEKEESEEQEEEEKENPLEQLQGYEYIQEYLKQNSTEKVDFSEYRVQEYTYKVYLQNIVDNTDIIQQFFNIEYIKYQEILQNIYFLLEYDKQSINEQDTNIFDQRNFRENLQQTFISTIQQYQYDTIKEQDFHQYQMVDVILQKILKIEQQPLQEYSYVMYLFRRLLIQACQLRQLNIQQRKQLLQTYNTIREQRITESQKREEKLKQDLEAAKNDFYSTFDEQQEKPEETESQEEQERMEFDPEEWKKTWIQENPEIQIPKEISIQEDTDIMGVIDTQSE